jgi:hypothetical protein
VWRPTTAAKRDWRSRHTATDTNGVESRDVTAASERHNINVQETPSETPAPNNNNEAIVDFDYHTSDILQKKNLNATFVDI